MEIAHVEAGVDLRKRVLVAEVENALRGAPPLNDFELSRVLYTLFIFDGSKINHALFTDF